MNSKLKAILTVAEGIAKATVPGAAQIDDAVRNVVTHQGDTDDQILDMAEGAIKAVEALDDTEIADEVQFRAGCAIVEQGYKMIRHSLKVTAPVTSPQADGAGT